MKLTSKYFDSIRIKGAAAPKAAAAAKAEPRRCQWKGCEAGGEHKAPVGRGQEGHFYLFCTDHVRQYNASYNYFNGMSDKDVEAFHKASITGHRPTWKTGAHGWAPGTKGRPAAPEPDANGPGVNDPHGFFSYRAKRNAGEKDAPQRYVKPLERKSLETLHLPENANKEQIKTRFKELVKQHHPDANGGDKRSEEKLREIIQAYNFLKSAGMV